MALVTTLEILTFGTHAAGVPVVSLCVCLCTILAVIVLTAIYLVFKFKLRYHIMVFLTFTTWI